MLHSLRGLQGYWLGAVDGRMGQVKDCYFDDQAWTVRYIVVDTGPRWSAGHGLPGRDVLISPVALKFIEWEAGILHTDLTKDQISNAPSVGADEPVTRQHEADLAQYFSWPVYWQSADQEDASTAYLAASGTPEQQQHMSRLALSNPPRRDPHLHSMHTVVGYTLLAEDEKAALLDDFFIDESGWLVRYLVADVGSWWEGEKVLIVPQWLDEIDWPNRQVRFAASREKIRNAPRFDPSQPISRDYETDLYAYYGQPGYWTE